MAAWAAVAGRLTGAWLVPVGSAAAGLAATLALGVTWGAGLGERGAGVVAGRWAAGLAGWLLRRNCATTSIKRAACSRRLSAAAEDSSTRAEFCCVI